MNNFQLIGFGTYRLKGEECVKMVYTALKVGYRLLDTASLYKNHKEVKEGIRLSGVDRNDIFLTSKIHGDDIKSGEIEKAFFTILEELETEYLDMVLLHCSVNENVNAFAWKKLEKLYAEGFVKNIGVSNYRITELEQLLKIAHVKPCLNQIEVSPFNTRKALVAYCDTNKIRIQAFGSLTNGKKLENKIIKSISDNIGISPAQILLNWALKKGFGVVPKTTSMVHLLENTKIYELTNAIIEILDDLNEDFYTIPKHRD